jgi:hypothetical protein
MITVNKYETIKRADFIKECITKDGGAVYCVSGIEVEDLLGDMENLNCLLVDNVVQNGYLLEGISYKFTGRASCHDGTAIIKVVVESTEEYLKEKY